MFNLFKKKEEQFLSPASGKLKNITDVDDEVFSAKSLGDGFAIEPKVGEVYSPITGTVSMIFPTLHAIGLINANGMELLIHIGVDSVNLDGEGFEVLVKEGQNIKAGKLISKFDLDSIKGKIPSTDIMFIFTSGEVCEVNKNGMQVEAKEENIVKIQKK